MDRHYLWTLGVLTAVLVVWLVLTGCDPLGTNDTTTTESTTTTVPPTQDVVDVATVFELQSNLASGRHVRVTQSLTTTEPIVLPDNFTLEFINGAGIARAEDAVGAAIDVSADDVTILDAAVLGTNPCSIRNFDPDYYNPAASGHLYSPWKATKDSAGIRWEERAAVYVRPGAERLLVDGLVAHNLWGDGVTITGGKDIALRDVHVRCAGRSGVSITEGENIRIADASFSGMFWWGLNIEPFGAKVVHNVDVNEAVFGYTRYPWLMVGFGEGANCQISAVDVSQVTLLPESSRPSRVQGCIAGQVSLPSTDHK